MAVITRYSGSWGKKQVVHLLKRTMFGAKPADIDHFKGMTMDTSVDEIITMPAAPNPPLNFYEGVDINGTPFQDSDGVPKGQTWVNGTIGDGTTNFFRGESLRAWWLGNMIFQGRSIQEKMVLFWHNHFCTEIRAGGGATAGYDLLELFRTYAMGQLKPLMIAVTKNPFMTFYLNGYLNTKYSPDENYARELQELFGVGKGPGSQYTEEDVRQAARVLTGHSLDWIPQTYLFRDTLHDTGDKQFSAFYNNKKISGIGGAAGEGELNELVDMIMATDECAKFIVRKVYRYFVNYDITPQVETDIIEPLATHYRTNNYEMKYVLEELLKSDHFFQANHIGAVIKSPLDFVAGMARESAVTMPDINTKLFEHYVELRYNYHEAAVGMQQALGDPPNVSGWPAYYQTPLYYELWVNSDTLPKRNKFVKSALNYGFTAYIDHVKFADQFSSVASPGQFIDDVVDCLYSVGISQTTKDKIKKDTLLSGQAQDYYWTNAWNDFDNNRGDQVKAYTVIIRIKAMLELLMQSSEYQLC